MKPSHTATLARTAAHAGTADGRHTAAFSAGGVLTVSEALQRATHSLADHSDSPRLDAELLLCEVLGLSRSALIVRGNDAIAVEDRGDYSALLTRRLRGEPVAYLTGTREFWSLPLRVTPDVLVPRPDTETLVDKALERLPAGETRAVLDLGTGSGAIALALATERPRAHIVGVDVSEKALDVAKANAQALGLPQIEWRRGSWFDAVRGERFDMIVSNPPYIAADDPALALLGAEPALALSPGPTGLEALAAIAAGAARHLQPNGWLLLEHGSTQAGAVAELLAHGGFTNIHSHADYAGKPRITSGSVHSSPQGYT